MKILSAVMHEETALTKKEIDEAVKLYRPFLKTLLVIGKDLDGEEPSKEAIQYLKSAEAKGTEFMTTFKFSSALTKKWPKLIDSYVKTKGDFEAIEDDLEDLAVELRDRLPKIAANQAMPHAIVNLFRNISLQWRTASESAYRNMQSNIGLLHDAQLNSIYLAQKVVKPTGAKAKVSALVKALTGKPGLSISITDSEKLRKTKPAKYKEYLAARRELLALGKKRLAALVGAASATMIDARKAADTLEKEGYAHTIPEGFSGQVDAQGFLYTNAGKKILGKPAGRVEMNPKYDPKLDNTYVLRQITEFGTNNVYTEEYRKNKNTQKFKKASDFADKIDGIRDKWGKALLNDEHKTQMAALILEISYQTTARIGNVGNQTDGKATYGLSTLECRHAKVLGANKIRLMYMGKAGQKQNHVLVGTDKYSRKACELLKGLVAEGAPSDPLVRFNNRAITSQTVNMYLKTLASGLTIKTVRTMRGTQLARELLGKSPFVNGKKVPNEKAMTDWLKKQLLEVGRLLGHFSGEKVTPTTALKHYISGDVIQEYYDAAGIRPPNAIEKIIHTNMELK